ncbi:MAG: PKD domain-containing protein [Candidatus Kapaibacterium sp.]
MKSTHCLLLLFCTIVKYSNAQDIIWAKQYPAYNFTSTTVQVSSNGKTISMFLKDRIALLDGNDGSVIRMIQFPVIDGSINLNAFVDSSGTFLFGTTAYSNGFYIRLWDINSGLLIKVDTVVVHNLPSSNVTDNYHRWQISNADGITFTCATSYRRFGRRKDPFYYGNETISLIYNMQTQNKTGISNYAMSYYDVLKNRYIGYYYLHEDAFTHSGQYVPEYNEYDWRSQSTTDTCRYRSYPNLSWYSQLTPDASCYATPTALTTMKGCHPLRTLNFSSEFKFIDDYHTLDIKNSLPIISNLSSDSIKQYSVPCQSFRLMGKTGTALFIDSLNKTLTLCNLPKVLPKIKYNGDFLANKTVGFVKDTISFSNSVYPVIYSSYLWDFGDGTTSTQQFPSHIYSKDGVYTVTLKIVSSNDTLVIKKDSYITINSLPFPKLTLWYQRPFLKAIKRLNFNQSSTKLVVSSQNVPPVILTVNSGDTVQSINSEYLKDQSKVNVVENLDIRFVGKNDSVMILQSINSTDRFLDISFSIFDSQNVIRYTKILPSICTHINGYDDARFNPQSNMYRHIHNFSGDVLTNENLFAIPVSLGEIWDSKSSVIFPPYHQGDTLGNLFRMRIETDTLAFFNLCSVGNVGNVFNPNDSLLRGYFSAQFIPNTNKIISSVNQNFKEVNDPCLLLVNEFNTGKEITRYIDSSICIRFSPDNFHLLTRSGLWDFVQGKVVQPLNIDNSKQFEFFPDGIHVAVYFLTDSTAVKIFNIQNNEYEFSYGKLPDYATAMALSPDGKYIAVGLRNGYVVMLSVPLLENKVQVDFTTPLPQPVSVSITDTVTFINTTLPVNGNYSYLWDFGDGSTSTLKQPLHRYSKSGIYDVELSVLDNGNTIASEQKLKYVTVSKSDNSVDLVRVETQGLYCNVLPNPVTSEFTIRFQTITTGQFTIIITDPLGNVINTVFNGLLTIGSHDFHLSNKNFSNGVYFIKSTNGVQTHIAPFCISN